MDALTDIHGRPISEVIPGLFVGGRPTTYKGFDLAINCERYIAPELIADGYGGMLIHVPMRDLRRFNPQPLLCDAAAAAAAMFLAAGRRVIVHCLGGRNRSGVVATIAIEAARGCTRTEALAILREGRPRDVAGRTMVNNPTFAEFLAR